MFARSTGSRFPTAPVRRNASCLHDSACAFRGRGRQAGRRRNSAIDAEAFFAAIVKIETRALPDARSAATLGTEREGTGVVIAPDGLILTIGYLLVEADDVKIVDDHGRTLPARVVALRSRDRIGPRPSRSRRSMSHRSSSATRAGCRKPIRS